MKSTLKILKDNIFTIFVILVFVLGMFLLSYIKKVYWDNNNEAAYGDRVDGVKNNYISDDMIKDIETSISNLDGVISAEYDLEGIIINLTVVLEDDVTVKDAKNLAEPILKNFSAEQLDFYSIQIYFSKNDSNLNNFPIMGYKHYSSDEISWTRDREVSNDEN